MNTSCAFTSLCWVSIILGVSSGCASHFDSLPTRDDFKKSVIQLEKKHPEMAQYNPSLDRFIFTPIWSMPYAEDLVSKWGEPQEKCWSWYNCLSIPVFHYMSRWYWRIEDKTVNVLIDRPLAYGYEPHVFTLKLEGGYGAPPPDMVDEVSKSAAKPPAAAEGSRTLTTKLTELKELRDKQLISDSEYEKMRAAAIEQFK